MNVKPMDLSADATELARRVRTGELSAIELTESAIKRVEAVNPKLNSIILPLFDKAREQARAVRSGPFTGVPYVLKDLSLFSKGDPFVAGIAGMKASSYRADHDSHFVVRMREAGFVLLGRANSPELGIMGTTEPLTWGSSRNPWDVSESIGGGGGAAAAVASGMVPVAHGNDGGGSVRITAGLCGLVGLMPSRGRISSGPTVHHSDSVSGVLREGLLTRSVRDMAAVLDVVSGHFPGDACGAPTPNRPFATEVGSDPGKLRIGVLDADPTGQVTVDPDCVRAVAAAANCMARLGHEVADSYPEILRAGSWPAEFNACLAVVVTRELERFGRLLGRPLTEADVEPATWGYAQAGRHISAVQYVDGIESLRVLARAIESWWSDGAWDLLLTPMMPVPALPKASGGPNDESFLTMAVALTRFTMPFNISGQPAISLPLFHRDDGMPVGVQLVAPHGREDMLIRIASQLEAAMPWAHRRPCI